MNLVTFDSLAYKKSFQLSEHSANGYGYISVMYSSRPAHVQNVPLHHADGPVQPHNSVVSESSYCAGSAHTKLKSTGVGDGDRSLSRPVE